MTYGNDACEMIELCNKRTFFDLRRFDAETLQLCHFPEFYEKKKFSFFVNRKNRNFAFSPFKEKKCWMQYCLLSLVSPALLLCSTACYPFCCFCACGRCFGKGAKSGLFFVHRSSYVAPAPLVIYGAPYVRRFYNGGSK